MTVPLLAEGDGGWEPAVAGAVVQRCCFDYAVTLHIAAASGWELRIEQPFVVIAADGTEHLVVPEERAGLPAALGLLGYRVVSISAHTDGRISAEFDQACRLEVPPSEGFEPWTLTGPDGVRLVSLPGVMALMALPSPHEVPSGERFWRLSFED